MLSGKLPPSIGTVPEAPPREDAPDTVRKRAVDGGTDVLSMRSSLVSHGAPRRAVAPLGTHAHHAHHSHRGASQTERVIATVARNIVVSGNDGSSVVTQEVDQVAFLFTSAAPPAPEQLDADDDIDIDSEAADDATTQTETAPPDDALAGGESLAESSHAERSTSHGTDSEQDPFALDGVQGTRGRDGPRTMGADADGGGGGWGGGGASGAGGVRAADGVEAASASTSIHTAGADRAGIARIERAAPVRRAGRTKTPHEHKAARIVGIGLAAAAVVLVLALLVAIFAPPTPGSRGEENEETRQDR